MPCDETRTISISMPNLNESLMNEVLGELGLRIAYQNGQLYSRRGISDETVTRIKQSYAKKAVKKVAKKHGWSIESEKEDSLNLER